MSVSTGSNEATGPGTGPRSGIGSPPADVASLVARYLEAFTSLATAGETGLYLAGSPALGDLSPRQSNIDLVAVTEAPLPDGVLRQLSRVHRSLRLNGRDAAVCYTTWDGLKLASGDPAATVYEGASVVASDRLSNPVTWAILSDHPVAFHGRSAPVVRSEPDLVKAWFAAQLPSIAERAGSLLWRRQLTRVVLQATRAGHAVLTGEVVSLRRAAELALPTASHTSHRVLTDALGYREGANTSMYWGPFERKANASTLTRDLLRLV